ncbi:MAG: hypothetical protein IJ329_02670 [Clostridia bacterium]|nr:hypothetical protein [Clostridia bacterium]
MKVYFLSSTPCALSLNGAYFGLVDGFERFAEVSLNDGVFAQFFPQNGLPIGCFLTQELRFTPPEGFEIYLLPDGIAVYARDFPPHDFTLQTIDQKRSDDTLVTLFCQGELQLSIESGTTFSVARLPRAFANANIRFYGNFIALETDTKLALYTKSGKCVFCENVLSHAVENDELNAVVLLSDSLGRIAECRYALKENECERTAITLKQARAENGETDEQKIAESLLPFAFFESVLLGADYTAMLSNALAEKADAIRSFLGEFVAVVPTRSANICGLVKKKKERLFEVTHYTVEIQDGKIADIRG